MLQNETFTQIILQSLRFNNWMRGNNNGRAVSSRQHSQSSTIHHARIIRLMNGLFLRFVAWNARRLRMHSINLIKEVISSATSIQPTWSLGWKRSCAVIGDSRTCDLKLISKFAAVNVRLIRRAGKCLRSYSTSLSHSNFIVSRKFAHLRSVEHVNPLGRRSILRSFEFIILFVSLSISSVCFFVSYCYWLPIEWTRLARQLLLFTYVAEENERKKSK